MSDAKRVELLRAQEDINTALLAFHAFMDLVKSGDGLNGNALYCLLEPVEDRFAKGLEQLDGVLSGG